ncbi:hypothetical protein F5984_13190 [Rudanella paleaurantiibacter]|uniref:Uncharacterized protein n=1 Tax=Rudanella paleaurantiibacter TaxID=2614655 RepID=A0A7J5TYC3_9BACT|nr:hypothetical protein [Rudanella paleaurantiibacter]KAB7730132.1 hypothetical protein F5984_13190 [Rudanella paleaurantiibacter]
MATLNGIWRAPALLWGYITSYVDFGEPFTLQPGQDMCLIYRRADRTNAAHKAKGITLNYQNAGSPDVTVNWDERATIDAGGGLFAAMGGDPVVPIPWSAGGVNYPGWTKQALDSQLGGMFSTPRAKRITTEIVERLSHDTDGQQGGAVWGTFIENGQVKTKGMGIGEWNASPQAGWMSERIAQLVRGWGGGAEYYGEYAGHLNLGPLLFNDTGQLRAALTGSALQVARNNPLFGDGYYSRSFYLHRSGCVKGYDAGDQDKNRATLLALLNFEVDSKAKAQAGITHRHMAIFFPGYQETLGETKYSVTYTYQTSDGGTVTRPTFPQYSYPMQIFVMVYALSLGYHLFAWESAERFGSNPDNVIAEGQVGMQYSGPPRTRYPSVQFYTEAAVGFPANPQSGYDLPLLAGHMYSKCREKTGDELSWGAHSTNWHGSTAVNGVVPADYLVDRLQNTGQGLFLLGRLVNERSYVYLSMLPPGQRETVTLNLVGGTHTFVARGGRIYSGYLTV